MFARLTKAWIERQYRLNFRVVLNGLIARGEPGTEEEIARKADRQAKASLKVMTKAAEELH